MDSARLNRRAECEWELPRSGAMRVPGVIYADEALIRAMDDKVAEQVANVAALPGIVKASFAMPDAHWGYGFPIGGVAAFDPDEGGVVSAGGVGFDISCGVRTLLTGLATEEVRRVQRQLADTLYERIPAGLGSTGALRLSPRDTDAMLAGGARWALKIGYGRAEDLERIEEHGAMAGADPAAVSQEAKKRQRDQMGTLGSGNHYLEVQRVAEIRDANVARAFGLEVDAVVVSIHCGSRGLGHQIGTDFLREMAIAARNAGIALGDRELACAPIRSPVGQRYLGAMRAAINCALANRQITHPSGARRVQGSASGREARSSLRRLAQHLQGGRAPGRRRAARAFRASQGRDARLRPRSSRSAAGIPGDRTTGVDRRQHGHVVVGARRNGARDACRVRIGLPRCRAQHEPHPGHEALARPRGGR